MIYIVETFAGIFALNDENKVIDKVLFEKNPEQIANILNNIQKGIFINEYKDLLDKINPKMDDTIIVEDSDLAYYLKNLNYEVITQIPSKGGKYIRKNLIQLLIDANYINNESEYSEFINKINSILTRKKISEASEKKDKLLCQTIEAIDQINKYVNALSERLHEWYGLHFPELGKLISNHNTYCKLVAKLGNRENFTAEALKEFRLSDEKIQDIINSAKNSMGANLKEVDMEQIRNFAQMVCQIYELRANLSDYLTDGMNKIAPNMSALIGPILAARLISMAGGLEELAKKPSSTIQVMGAEQALFRSLRTGSKPPKHGLIFHWEGIHGAPWWLRGKISRALAGKLSIASRLDAYSAEDHGDELVADLNARITEIKTKYPKPKKKPKKKKSKRDRKRSRKRTKKK
ncbi:MAG: C/D box methylation guide ribonucleoprotein complex aNOP56 subunit [Candidatus Helarchaeota archaeon]